MERASLLDGEGGEGKGGGEVGSNYQVSVCLLPED